ncbi:MTHFR-domain-containing protein [Dichomitus squalens]|uniref:MTHFR-domain-containing protein n=1 Tax=Dichomitus squalens TaxID=114155 RepID=A0A4V2K5Y8_9APHY|nr:MTHFR-domain-containing protein [Dichomitus squalens]TBU50323.1 MTHFR-domain-containing protein [Dichomitus squalens]TBU65455.1 MTHFR-domain-containing protein [Dichomitus squalens]
MKLTDRIAQHDPNRLFYTFEFFPPKTDQGFENLVSRIARMVALNPLSVSVTWGAGGTTKDRSLDLAGLTQLEHGIDTTLHLTCTNMVQGTVDAALREAKERGIENILALRGDPPRGSEHWIPTDSRFQHGVDLVRYIKSTPEFAHFCVGVAAYPDGHPDRDTTEDRELDHLKEKVNAGAEFIITQLFYDVNGFLQWVKKVREKGITVPIIPGIMPIQTYASFLRMTKLCATSVPPKMMSDLVPIRHDDQKVKDYGVRLAVDMIRQLQAGGIQGVHFCTLNLEKSIIRILEALGLAGDVSHSSNKLIADDAVPPERTVTPHTAADRATKELATSVPEPDASKGEINSAADWDDFPNGRFGDFKSPAYGETDRWGSSALQSKAATTPVSHWGNPKTVNDLTSLFLRYLHSKITTTPFSSTPLSPESLMIFPHLEKLTSKGWWTVGSQPAINGAPSTDEVVGWGPRGGYVYQKCFVEFFVAEQDVNRIARKVDSEGAGWISYFAGTAKGDVLTNVPEGGRNAVTWGVFPGQEIAQTTIIEKESFLSWKDEAFSIWDEWASFYPPESQERRLLEDVRDKRWLVSLVHHDYMDPNALWTFLFKGATPLL